MSLNFFTMYKKDLKDLDIDASLNRKIMQNENKLQALFNISKKKKGSHSIDQKGINKEKNKIIKKNNNANKKQPRNFNTYYYNQFNNNDNNNDDDNDNEHEMKKNLSQYYSPNTMISDYDFNEKYNNKPLNVIKVNQNMKKVKHASNKTSSKKLHPTRNNNKNKKYEYKPKRKLNISARNNNSKTNIRKNSINSNSNTLHKDYSTIDYSVKSERYLKNVNVEKMMDRFQKDEDRKKEWIENQKKKREEEEKKTCSHVPKINKVSQKINLKLKDDFLERQKLKDEQKKKKEEKLKEFLNKKKEEEINKNNPLLKVNKKNKDKDNLNSSRTSSKTLNKTQKVKINNAINKLYEWDKNRKEKINQKRKTKNEKMEKFDYVPKINKRSASMAEFNKKKYKEKDIFNRLAQKDPYMVEKRKLLEDLYTPSFKPNINTKKIKYKNENEDNDNNGEKHLKSKGVKKLEEHYLSDDDIQELYRNTIFNSKKKKHIRSKSVE